MLLLSRENFQKATIFKHDSFTQHAMCCRARDVEFWEAVGRVPFDQRKFRKFEPVIFVEWKAPITSPFLSWEYTTHQINIHIKQYAESFYEATTRRLKV